MGVGSQRATEPTFVGSVGVRGGARLALPYESAAAVGNMNGNELCVLRNMIDTLSSVCD